MVAAIHVDRTSAQSQMLAKRAQDRHMESLPAYLLTAACLGDARTHGWAGNPISFKASQGAGLLLAEEQGTGDPFRQKRLQKQEPGVPACSYDAKRDGRMEPVGHGREEAQPAHHGCRK